MTVVKIERTHPLICKGSKIVALPVSKGTVAAIEVYHISMGILISDAGRDIPRLAGRGRVLAYRRRPVHRFCAGKELGKRRVLLSEQTGQRGERTWLQLGVERVCG